MKVSVGRRFCNRERDRQALRYIGGILRGVFQSSGVIKKRGSCEKRGQVFMPMGI